MLAAGTQNVTEFRPTIQDFIPQGTVPANGILAYPPAEHALLDIMARQVTTLLHIVGTSNTKFSGIPKCSYFPFLMLLPHIFTYLQRAASTQQRSRHREQSCFPSTWRSKHVVSCACSEEAYAVVLASLYSAMPSEDMVFKCRPNVGGGLMNTHSILNPMIAEYAQQEGMSPVCPQYALNLYSAM